MFTVIIIIILSRNLHICSIMTRNSISISITIFYIIICGAGCVSAVDLPFIALAEAYTAAYNRLTAKATTIDCKTKIMNAFQENWESFFHEEAMPFEREPFYSQCPLPDQANLPALKYEGEEDVEYPTGIVIHRREVDRVDHKTLGILYVMLVHQDPKFVTEIIESLNEPMHTFVLHVDTKSPETFSYLSQYISTYFIDNRSNQNVFVMHENRVETNWGAFSIVDATLNALKFGLLLNRSFDYAIDISGTTHPIKSNNVIRQFLARNVNTIYNGYGTESVVPLPELLHQYVECDGFVHRVARLTRPRGIAVYVGSQWFAMPRHVAEWLLSDPLPIKYKQYAQHVVVADEQYFATMLMNSPFCGDMMNKDLNYLIFTDFLAERGNIHKCLHPDPLRCGRSPTTLTMSMQPTIQMSHALFARKFNPINADSMALLATIKETLRHDQIREREQERIVAKRVVTQSLESRDDTTENVERGEFMIVMSSDDVRQQATQDYSIQKRNNSRNESAILLELLSSSNCLSFPFTAGDPMEVMACNSDDQYQRFVRSKCVSIDTKKFPEFSDDNDNVQIIEVEDETGNGKTDEDEPRMQKYCSLRGVVKGHSVPGLMHEDEFFCVDIAGSTPIPGNDLIAYPCQGSWNQYFRTSTHRLTGTSSIASTIPRVVSNVTGMSAYPNTLCVEWEQYTSDSSQGQNDDAEVESREEDGSEDNTDIIFDIKSNICRGNAWNNNNATNDNITDQKSGDNDAEHNAVASSLPSLLPPPGIQRFRFVNLSLLEVGAEAEASELYEGINM